MKYESKRIISTLLVAAMICTNLTSISLAKSGSWTHGWLNENNEWHYYEKDGDGEIRKDDFAFSSTDVQEVFTMYYLDEKGELVENEGGSTIAGPDGKEYLLTAGGAVKGGQLGSYYDGQEEDLIWYTEPSTGKLACDVWRQIQEEDGEHWYYFRQAKNDKKGIGYALQDEKATINGKWYQFDERGRIAENTFIDINLGEYKAYAQVQGDFAKNKWLYIDNDWFYFENITIDDWDEPVPVALTGIQVIDGITYEFDEEGCLISDNAPYNSIDSVEISTNEENVFIGEKVTVDFDIQVASSSDATIATMSNAEKKALTSEKAYDAYVRYKGPGMNKVSKLDSNSSKLQWSFTPTVEGDIEISFYVDGMNSDSIQIYSKMNPGKQGNASYMKTVFSGIMNSQLSGDEVVRQLTNKYQEMDIDTITKLRDSDEILQDLQDFEKRYRAGQGIGRYKEDLSSIKELMDTKLVSVVGAYLNADVNMTQGATLSMVNTSTTDISGVEGDKKVAIDITLTSGDNEITELELPITITMPIPKGLSKDGLKVYHIHDGITEEMPLSEKQLQKDKVRFTTDGLSTFAFASDSADNSGNSSSGSSSSGGSSRNSSISKMPTIPETPGQWKQTAKGWQFLKADGTLYYNTWIYVAGKWYWLEADGVMIQGWKDVNGKRYYFRPVSGDMAIGWILDGSQWYYTDTDGHMLSSTVTPDGYTVDENGIWLQK